MHRSLRSLARHCSIAVLAVVPAVAQQAPPQDPQSPIQWSGEIRIRSEVDGRDFMTRTPFNVYTLSRVRLAASVPLGASVKAYIQVQDSRTFGEEKDAAGTYSTTTALKNVDLHQAYIQVDKFLSDALSFTLGRMERSYGNERVISPSGWNNVARSFDGVVVRYSHPAGFIDALAFTTADNNTIPVSLNAARVRYARDTGQVAAGIYSSTRFLNGDMSADVYGVYQYDAHQTRRDTADIRRLTVGALLKGRRGPLSGDIEFSFQTGTRYDPYVSKPGVAVSAYMLAASAAYEPGLEWVSNVSAYVDVLSGRSSGDRDARSYEPVFPSSHRYFGFADYFTSFPTQTFDRGIVDLYARVGIRPGEQCTMTTTLHRFMLQNLVTIGPVSSRALGDELDIVAQWKYSKNLTFESGLAVFAPGTVMRTTYGGSDLGTHGYITAHVQF